MNHSKWVDKILDGIVGEKMTLISSKLEFKCPNGHVTEESYSIHYNGKQSRLLCMECIVEFAEKTFPIEKPQELNHK